VRLCTERQRQTIRALLGRAGQTEDWLLAKLQVQGLEAVHYERAQQVIHRLGELARERTAHTQQGSGSRARRPSHLPYRDG
jgi:hypothetical protein